jgi:1,5-anhydro-D-fructose reductase (1,5-anhydro-D-mannitol-forming)
MLKIGIVGFGFMGRMHYRCWRARPDAQVVAICDVNSNIIEDSQKEIGNIGGAADAIDFSNIRTFTSLDTMLREVKLDAVSITLPTFMHPDSSTAALRAGVNVLCEKPMALTATQCEPMIAAASASGKTLMIGQCERFSPVFLKAKQIIDSGEYGQARVAGFRRVGAAPTWAWQNWFGDDTRSGGMELDLHIHDADLVQYLFGLPDAVSSVGYKVDGNKIGHIQTRYIFDDWRLITAEAGWMMAPTFGFEVNFMIMLDRATLVYDSVRKPAFKVYPPKGESFVPVLADGDGYTLEVDHFARRIQGEKLPEVTTPQQARDSVLIIQKERQSVNEEREIEITNQRE